MRDKFSLAIKNSGKKTIIYYFTPLECMKFISNNQFKILITMTYIPILQAFLDKWIPFNHHFDYKKNNQPHTNLLFLHISLGN